MDPEKEKINLLRALLIEADKACQKIMIQFLQDLKYEVDLIDEDLTALILAQQNLYELIIISDINILGLIYHIRKSKNIGTPIIIWSSSDDEKNKEMYFFLVQIRF